MRPGSTRRGLLAVLLASAAIGATAGEAEAANRLSTAKAGRPGSGSASFTVTGNGFGDTTFATSLPLLADTKVMRSFQTTQNEGDIGIAEECGPYRSPPAAYYLVTGTDVADFEASPVNTGYIRFKSSTISGAVRKNRVLTIMGYRAGVGWGNPKTLTVGMTANASDEYFVTISAANQSGDGSKATPWKYTPGSADYTSAYSGTLGGGKCIFVKGETHATTLLPSKTDPSARLSLTGTSGNISYTELNGWGSGAAGRAIYTGDVAITGTPAAPTQAQAGGNANYASMKRVTGQTYIEDFQRVYCGPDMLYEAAWPTPQNLKFSEGVDYAAAVGSEKFGTRNYPVQTTGGTRRIYCNGPSADGSGGSVTTVTVVDPDFAALFGGISSATLAASGLRGLYRYYSNFFQRMALSSWNGTDTLVFSASGAILSTGGPSNTCSFGLRNHPALIATAGQVAVDANRTDMVWWETNAGQVSISRLYSAVGIGNSGYWTHRGGQFQRFCSGILNAGAVSKNAGVANWYAGSGTVDGCDMINGWYMQCHNPDSSIGVFNINGGFGIGITGSNFMLNYMSECGGFSGFRFPGLFQGLSSVTDGDWASVEASSIGQIAYNSTADYALEGTYLFTAQGRGQCAHHNITLGLMGIHANVYSPYDIGSGTVRMMLIKYNISIAPRFYTNQKVGSGGFYHKIESCIVLNPTDQNEAIACNDGFEQGTINRCLALSYGSRTPANYAIRFSAGGPGMVISNTVAAGMKENYPSTSWQGALSNIILTWDSGFSTPVNSTNGGTKTNVTQYNGTSQPYIKTWDETFPADWKALFGPGDIGAFHVVPA